MRFSVTVIGKNGIRFQYIAAAHTYFGATASALGMIDGIPRYLKIQRENGANILSPSGQKINNAIIARSFVRENKTIHKLTQEVKL